MLRIVMDHIWYRSKLYSSLILNMVGGMDGDDETFLNSKTCRKVMRLSAMRRVAGTIPLTARLVQSRYNLMYIGSSRSEEGWKIFC